MNRCVIIDLENDTDVEDDRDGPRDTFVKHNKSPNRVVLDKEICTLCVEEGKVEKQEWDSLFNGMLEVLRQDDNNVENKKRRQDDEHTCYDYNCFLNDSTEEDDDAGTAAPYPDLYKLFQLYNFQFFHNQLESVEVKWSTRMTLCAGVCIYQVI